MPEWDRPAEPRPRRWVPIAGLVVVAAGLGLALDLGGYSLRTPTDPAPDPERLVIEEGPAPDELTTQSDDDVESRVAEATRVGAWFPLPGAPVPGRAGAFAVWTGEEALFWGGRDSGGWRSDGAAWDPSARTWRALPEAPFAQEPETLAVFDGRRLVVLRGSLGGAAAYDPSTDRWEEIAAPPADGRWTAMATLGDDVYLTGTHRGCTAVLRLAGDVTWDPLPAPPVQGGAYALSAVGDRLILLARMLVGSDGLSATAYDPLLERWTEAEPVPVADNWTPAVAEDGARRLLLGGPSHERSSTHRVLAWTSPGRAGAHWLSLPHMPNSLSRAAPQLQPVGRATLAWALDDPSTSAWLAHDDSGWVKLAAPPEPMPPGTAAVWTGQELVVWGSRGGGVLTLRPRQAVLLPVAGTPRYAGAWIEHGPPPDPRSGPTLGWVGDELLVWGGRRADDGMPVDGGYRWQPGSEDLQAIADPPVELANEPFMLVDGMSVVFAGGRTDENWTLDAAVHSVDARASQVSWRRLPPAPLPEGEPQVGGAVAGRIHLAAGDPPQVVALDHDAGRWEALPRLPDDAGAPTGVVAVDGVVVVTTERASWALEASASSWQPLAGVPLSRSYLLTAAGPAAVAVGPDGVLALRPGEDGWRSSALPLADVDDGWPVWDGEYVVLWGAVTVGDHIGGREGAAAYDVSADRWLVLPDPPQGVALGGPAVAAGRDVLFWSRWGVVSFRADVGAALAPGPP